jgi:hypothetical protein
MDANQFGLNSRLNLIRRLFALAHWAGARPAPTFSFKPFLLLSAGELSNAKVKTLRAKMKTQKTKDGRAFRTDGQNFRAVTYTDLCAV